MSSEHGDRLRTHEELEHEDEIVRPAVSPGKRTLTSRLRGGAPAPAPAVQRKASLALPPGEAGAAPSLAWEAQIAQAPTGPAAVQARGDLQGDEVAATAQAGTEGGGEAMPFGDRIQASFGHHDVSGIRAHTGDTARDAATAIGAEAYATGGDVVFGAEPTLHTAAHEAAHVVQQRAGVQLAGGVGRAGDVYEQHADAVADRVVRGESAEALLDTMARRGAAGGPAVQRVDRDGDGLDDATGEPVAGRGPRSRTQGQAQFTFELPERQLGRPARLGLVTVTAKIGGQVSVQLTPHRSASDQPQEGDTTTTVTQGVTVDSDGGVAYHPQVQHEINRRILGFTPSLVGDLEVSGDGATLGVGGQLNTADQGTVGIRQLQAQIILAEWDRSESGSGLRLVGADLSAAVGIPPFQMRLGPHDAQIAPQLDLKLELDPNWREIGRRLLQRLAAQGAQTGAGALATGGGAAATDAALAGAGAGLGGLILPAVLGTAVGIGTAIAVADALGQAEDITEFGETATYDLYNYCLSYTSTFLGGPSLSGTPGSAGGRAARADLQEIARQGNSTVEQVREAATALGQQEIYEAVFNRAFPGYSQRAAHQAANLLGDAPLYLMEGQLRRARWGASWFMGRWPNPASRRR